MEKNMLVCRLKRLGMAGTAFVLMVLAACGSNMSTESAEESSEMTVAAMLMENQSTEEPATDEIQPREENETAPAEPEPSAVEFSVESPDGSARAVIRAIVESGEELWRFESSAYDPSGFANEAVLRQRDGVYYLSAGGNVYAVQSDGGLLWEYESTIDPSYFEFDAEGNLNCYGPAAPQLLVLSTDGTVLSETGSIELDAIDELLLSQADEMSFDGDRVSLRFSSEISISIDAADGTVTDVQYPEADLSSLIGTWNAASIQVYDPALFPFDSNAEIRAELYADGGISMKVSDGEQEMNFTCVIPEVRYGLLRDGIEHDSGCWYLEGTCGNGEQIRYALTSDGCMELRLAYPDDEENGTAGTAAVIELVHVSASTSRVQNIVDPENTTTYELLQQYLLKLSGSYPEIIQLGSYGTSVMGRNLYYMKLGTGEKELLVVGSIHGCEHLTSSYLLKCVEEYASAWASNSKTYDGYDIEALLSEYTIWIVPNCNPDSSEYCITGSAINFTAYEARHNMKANANGTNLNNNFPFIWDQKESNGYPHEYKYKGPSAASEPESQALMKLCDEHEFLCMLSFHTQGQVIYWRDETNGEIPGDEVLVNALIDYSGFRLIAFSFDKSSYSGGFENWFRAEYNRPGLCIELVPSGYVERCDEYECPYFYEISRFDTTRDMILVALETLSSPEYAEAVSTAGTGTE